MAEELFKIMSCSKSCVVHQFFVQGYKKGQGPYNLSKYMYFMSIRMKMCLK